MDAAKMRDKHRTFLSDCYVNRFWGGWRKTPIGCIEKIALEIQHQPASSLTVYGPHASKRFCTRGFRLLVNSLVTAIQRKLAMRLLQLGRLLCFMFLLLHESLLNPPILPFSKLPASLLVCILDLVAVIIYPATSNFGMPAGRRFSCALGYSGPGFSRCCEA